MRFAGRLVLKAETPEEKKRLAEFLSEHEPEMLDFLLAAKNAFGLSQSVEYSTQLTVAKPVECAKVDPRLCWWMK